MQRPLPRPGGGEQERSRKPQCNLFNPGRVQRPPFGQRSFPICNSPTDPGRLWKFPHPQSVPSGVSPGESHYQPLQRGDWSPSSGAPGWPTTLEEPGRNSFTERQYFSTALLGHLGWLSPVQIGGKGARPALGGAHPNSRLEMRRGRGCG